MAPATGCRPRWHMARFVPVPGHAAVAHLSARPLTPVLGTLPPQDMEVLRCADLDARLLINVLGNLQPADTLHSAEGRMRAIAAALPCRGVLLASTALWVHVGGPPPESLEVSLPGGRRSRLPYLVQAVQAILTARNHGVSRVRLLLTLNHCRGAASRGCPRAQHIIESVTFLQ